MVGTVNKSREGDGFFMADLRGRLDWSGFVLSTLSAVRRRFRGMRLSEEPVAVSGMLLGGITGPDEYWFEGGPRIASKRDCPCGRVSWYGAGPSGGAYIPFGGAFVG